MKDTLWDGVGVLTLHSYSDRTKKKKKNHHLFIMDSLGLNRDLYLKERSKDFLLKKQTIFKDTPCNQSLNYL